MIGLTHDGCYKRSRVSIQPKWLWQPLGNLHQTLLLQLPRNILMYATTTTLSSPKYSTSTASFLPITHTGIVVYCLSGTWYHCNDIVVYCLSGTTARTPQVVPIQSSLQTMLRHPFQCSCILCFYIVPLYSIGCLWFPDLATFPLAGDPFQWWDSAIVFLRPVCVGCW